LLTRTDDQQWIHVDPARAATESPFQDHHRARILTLSLVSMMPRRGLLDR